MNRPPLTTLVVPTVGRPSLHVLMTALAAGTVAPERPVVVVDDRPAERTRTPLPLSDRLPCLVVRSGGRGPAAARNLGWRHVRTGWVSFLDDDVVPDHTWYATLIADLVGAPSWVVGSQGNVRVPLPDGRRPTDWERGTAGLATATWITADMSYRRTALARVGGFDERFPRAYREDADLGLRITARGSRIARGERWVSHPVRPSGFWASVRQQAGNADDVLMRRLHGASWRERARAPRGRRRRHLVTTLGAVGLIAATGLGRWRLALVSGAVWLGGTAELALRRIAPGPRDPAEVVRMTATSAVIPVVAVWHTGLGLLRWRRPRPWQGLPDLVLFDRDGTLVHDVPHNADPARVEAVPGARDALDRLRHKGIRVGVVTDQSGVGSGRISGTELDAVNAAVERLLGPFETTQVCPHTDTDGCGCRKPAPGLVTQACAELGVPTARCVVIGDIGSDVAAARAAGAHAVLVPNGATRADEVQSSTHVCADLGSAVDDLFAGRW